MARDENLLSKQLDANPTTSSGSQSGRVEFHHGVDEHEHDSCKGIIKEQLLRYPGGVARLAHLAVQDKQHSLKTKEQIQSQPSAVVVGVSQDHTISSVPLLPQELIQRHKLTVAEIRSLPRFGKYEQGIPTKVLYIKNIHSRVTFDDLSSVFGRFTSTADGNKGVKIRLLTGRMRGQAFVEFKSVCIATAALEFASGYSMYGKPLVISYGKGKSST